jgi:hypothetical protein
MDEHVKATILEDIVAGSNQNPYEAVDVLWVALMKSANTMAGGNEHRRMLALVGAMPEEAIRRVLQLPAVDDLLDLNPPLETVLVDRYERLASEATQQAIQIIRSKRQDDPKGALVALAEILKRIRNKRAHGFKTMKGPRDQVILGAAKSILAALCRGAVAYA